MVIKMTTDVHYIDIASNGNDFVKNVKCKIPVNTIGDNIESSGRKVFYVDIGELSPDITKTYLDDIIREIKCKK
jgi:hypothetical protein